MTNSTIPTKLYGVSVGSASTNPFITVFNTRNPTSADVNYQVQQRWYNTSNQSEWMLISFSTVSAITLANWLQISVTNTGVETLTGNTGGTISPTSNNINTLGAGSITIAGSGSTLTTELTGLTNHAVLVGAGTATITKVSPSTAGYVLTDNGATSDPSFQAHVDLHTARFIVSAGGSADGANYTTIAAAYAAAVTAGAPQTVFIQDGIYTENITGVSGINLCAFNCNGIQNVQGGSTPNVILKGTFTASYSGSVSCSGIQFQTNGAAAIATTGSNTTALNLQGCSIYAQNATGITLNNATSVMSFLGCTFSNASTNALWVETASNGIDFENCVFSTNGTASASSMARARAVFEGCDMAAVDITTSGSGMVFVNACYWQYGGQILLTTAGTGTSEIYNCYLRTDNSSTISIGTGTIVNMANCIILSTATNAITGAGILNSSNLTFQSSRGNNVSTQNNYPVSQIYSPGGITFDDTNVLSNYATNTYSPALAFGGLSTGITYSTQAGEYTQIGNVVFFNVFLLLSSKGSASGGATVSLPINTGGGLVNISAGYWSNITLTANFTTVGAYAQSNVLNLTQAGSAQADAGLSNTNFSNTSGLGISGFYYTS